MATGVAPCLVLVLAATSFQRYAMEIASSLTPGTLPDSNDDVSDVTWEHAVNSLQKLDDALAGEADFLEADVSMGHLVDHLSGPALPIMAHPPQNKSGLSLERWIDAVIARGNGKGVKLDFKMLEAVEPSLQILQRHRRKITFPLWLNADILPGPVKAPALPVSAAEFLEICGRNFSDATLSLGWTTYYFPRFPPEALHYSWGNVRGMSDVVRCRGLGNRNITFPVRAIFVRRSLPQMQWILETFKGSTLTVWSAPLDPVDVNDLLKIRESFKASRVYYDLPEPLLSNFRSKKADHKFISMEPSGTYKWTAFDRSTGSTACSSHTYVNNGTILFGKEVESGILMSDVFHVSEGHILEVEGMVTFFDTDEVQPTTGVHTLSLVLADVGLFSKGLSGPEGDYSDVIWHATNQSVLHEFQHDFLASPESCRYFSLNSSPEVGFQVWRLPCETLDDGMLLNETLKTVGVREETRGKRLVLPSGDIMFGMISSGPGHVAVHQIHISGSISAKSPSERTNCAFVTRLPTLLGVLAFLSFVVFAI